MATAFTHALAGGLLSSFSPHRSIRLRLALTLALLAVLPDADVLGFRWGIPYEHPLGHRGFTHSILFAVLVGVAVAAFCFRDLGLGSRSWCRVAGLLVLGTASHGLLDAFTDAGLGIGFFIPFHEGRWFFLWRPLATSPLSVRAFFGGPALDILLNEALWVWLPLGTTLFLGHRVRRRWN